MLSVALVVAGPLAVAALVSAARRAEAAERAHALTRGSRWRVPGRARAPLERALAEADLALAPEQAVELWCGGAGILALVAAGLSPGLVVPTLSLALVAGPGALVLARGRARRRFATALPGALEHVSAHLRGGGTVAQGIAGLATGAGPLASDLRRVQARADLGVGLAEALSRWPVERDVPDVRAAAGGLAVAATVGGRSAEALDGLAVSLRDRLGAVAEARSLSAQARLSAVIVGAAPVAYVAFSTLVDPGSMAVLVGSGIGRVCLIVGLILEACAAYWMRRIVATTDA